MKAIILALGLLMNINPYLNPNHQALFQSTDEELVVYGGTDAGKSFSIADKLLIQAITQSQTKIKALIIRKTFPSLRNTALEILTERAELFQLPFLLNKSEWTAKCGNMKFIFLSLNNKEDFSKLKSMTGVDYVWINEATEIREDDYEECLRRMRGGKATFSQIIVDFNPIGRTSWVYKRFFDRNIGTARKLRYTIFDNHPDYLKTPEAQRFIERLKRTKKYDPNLFKIYFEGKWGELEGRIYGWDVVPLPKGTSYEIFYGGDFGYSIDPAAVVKIYRKADEFWLQEVIYKTGLTNQALGKEMKDKGITENNVIYFDSAEPKSIQELCNMGLNAKPCRKGADSVRAGIDFIKSKKVHIVDGSTNIDRETSSYVWDKDKDGNALNTPVDFNNHLLDAVRYGIDTHCNKGDFGFEV